LSENIDHQPIKKYAGRYETYPTPRRVAALIMPAAGQGAGQKVIDALEGGQWKAEVKIFRLDESMESHHEAVQAAYEWGADRLIASGGDGTVARVVSAMHQRGETPIPICIVPTGTGNVVAVDLGIPKDIQRALALAFQRADVYWWDVGRVGSGEYFLLRASAGHDARTLSMVNRYTKKLFRNIAYAVPGAYMLLAMRNITFELEIDDQPPIQEVGMTAFAAVTGRISGPWAFYLSKKIRPDDGVMYAGVMHLKNLIYHLPRIIRHRALEYDGFDALISLYPVQKRVVIRAHPPQATQIDGDLLDYQTPLEAEILPNAVPFVVRAKTYRHHTTEYVAIQAGQQHAMPEAQ